MLLQPRMPPPSPSLLCRTSMAAICTGMSQHNCVDMFQNSASLRKEGALEAAFSSFESCLRNCGAEGLEELLWAVCSAPNGFAFMYASLSSDCAAIVSETLFATIPSTAEDFASSLISTVLGQLSKSFWFAEYSGSRTLREHHLTVDFSLATLQTIATLSFQETGTAKDADDSNDGHGKHKTQRHLKNARKYKKPMIDTTAFEKLNVAVPTSQQEADNLVATIVADQRDILKYYLYFLRLPERAESFKQLSAGEIDSDVHGNNEQTGSDCIRDTTSVDAPSAYPFVQPKKAALYFESAEGFGDWRILISTRADRALRETRKKDSNLFKIVVKKIKELSRGHFSDDNQKRLTGPSGNNIPIYEAKMTSDTRLVYHIDCVKDYDSEVEWQAIRIFGIYTHAKLDERLWAAVSNQLSGQGKEYRRRCIFRKPPAGGGNVYRPASFPPLELDSATSPTVVRIPDLRVEDRDELHALLVLEKFVTFSQALLNSILANRDVSHVFQMSPKEQDIVKHTQSCFVLGRSGTGKTTTMLFKMLGIERSYDSHDKDLLRPRQLFVTQSQVLADKVQEYYFKLSESHTAGKLSIKEYAALAARTKARKDIGLVNRDEEAYHYDDLPKKFSELQDSHFPLFLRFDHLCRLLEADFIAPISDDPTSLTVDYIQQNRRSLVSYVRFQNHYWQHFPQTLTKNLDPALVFAEIIGVIKGNELALKSEKGYLDEATYLDLSERSQCTFASQRETIYAIFLSYLRLKAERREYDDADRTHLIIRHLCHSGITGKKLDFIYVDEAQDNLLIDALVLRSICRNPNGLFWAGDTAQTISAGSAFRFNDLKAFMYRVEESTNDDVNITRQPQPKTFELTVNYRSHGGIMGCANSVVQLITKFWPHAIDNLAEESGVVDGAKPLFFSGWNQDTARFEQFLFGSSGGQIEFGHHQCILVRDAAARDRLKSQVGEIGIIMTIYDSKGLEFDDVLLYNFFEDSSVELSQWRVVLNAISSDEIKCPRFDEVRHTSICRELKFLYVAITRARKNLWIADASTKGEPMRTVWNSAKLVQNCAPGDKIPHIAVSSSPDEWAKTGRHLFDLGRYPQAAYCYQRADLIREKDIALAYQSRDELQARSWPLNMQHERRNAFVSIAEEFLRLAFISPQEALSYYRIAAECFTEVGEDLRAAEAYFQGQEYHSSANAYRKAEHFYKAFDVVKSHSADIDLADAESIIKVAKVYYLRNAEMEEINGEPKHAASIKEEVTVEQLFGNTEHALEFAQTYDFNNVRARMLVAEDRAVEAASLYVSEGNIEKAVPIYLDHNKVSEAEQCLVDALWQHHSLGSSIDNNVLKLLEYSTQLFQHPVGSALLRDQISAFRAIASRDVKTLEQLGTKFRNRYQDKTTALLCFDHAYDDPPEIQQSTTYDVASVFCNYHVYVNLLLQFCFRDLLSDSSDANVARLFALEISHQSSIYIQQGTFLHKAVSEVEDRFGSLSMRIGRVLRNRLTARIRALHDPDSHDSHWPSAFHPCIANAVFRQCFKTTCYMSHVPRELLGVGHYHSRLRIHFQYILIYQALRSSGTQKRLEKANVLVMLYHAMTPATSHLGTSADFDSSRIPESIQGMYFAKEWIEDSLYSADEWADHAPFLSRMAVLYCLAFQLDAVSARKFILDALAQYQNRPPQLMRLDGQKYVLYDLFLFLDGNAPYSITAGIRFLQHVVPNRFNIDIGMLCNLVDSIYASLIVMNRLRRYNTLHDTTLPRSWLVAIAGDPRLRDKDVHLSLQRSLLFTVKTLLEDVYKQSEHLFLSNRPLFTYGGQVRNVFVARLCRTLSLFGYNVPFFRLYFRKDVKQILNSLAKEDTTLALIYRRYANANNWEDVVGALRSHQVHFGSQCDPLIQLKQKSFVSRPVHTPWGTHTIVYEHMQEVVPLLQGYATQTGHAPRPDAESMDNRDLEDDRFNDSTQEEHEDENAYTAEDATVETLEGEEILPGPTHVPLENVIAASIIQRWYRALVAKRRRRKALYADPLYKWSSACLKACRSLKNDYYKRPFYHALPSVLLSLSKMYVCAEKARKGAVKDLKKAENNDLEVAAYHVDQAKSLFREVLRAQKQLSPSSDFHKDEDLTKLRTVILGIEQISSKFPQTEANEWKNHLKVASQKIAQKPEKRPKPQLNTEDLDSYY
ncbi:hypothetical protein C8Q75DRAFT_57347 [Abortiporus biennis]|nr:hypothetical protein C8Q75DRAFT_57347 [Abortiporus biennis]